MDFSFPEPTEAFRTELRQFLREELPEWWSGIFGDDERMFPFTREFCKKLAARGWLTMAWPKQYGGADADLWMQMVVREEMWAHGEPRGPQYMNLNYIGPAIMMFGTPEQKDRYLKPMANGDALWCQGFSEPGAGSDLAAISTQAQDNGQSFVVRGQKIWTSYATAADHCFLLARTDPEALRYKGLSMFLLDMRTPGITVRPIDSMGGPVEFSEVFFDDVEVPYDCLLGPRNEGWMVAMSALGYERTGIAWHSSTETVLDRLIEYAKTTRDENGEPLAKRQSVREALVRMHVRTRAAKMLSYRVISDQAKDVTKDEDPAIAKVFATELGVYAGEVGMEILGSKGQLVASDPMAPLAGQMYGHWVHSIPMVIAAGSNEIQRNIIAQRGLALPR
ncbi:MAG: acyl-CoA dehydrogenase family protein [Alphaproteobacteria bacterium]|jgi:alkylation response protein AidB-like acyl-CoA dehydrogenase|nr:acyl-CoA dehydrogenase family protein [Alphaproteobacteria bacterium]